MNWASVSSLDQLWRSPTFPMWLTLAAAGFFGIVVLITLLRAEKSVANGALSIITLLAIGIAVAATLRGYGPTSRGGSGETRSAPQMSAAALPALSCIDDLAGDIVLSACEKALFSSPETVAAAVTYTASQIARLTALGDAAIANRNLTPELQALRHAVERDRYGLAAQVLVARDHCTPTQCAAFRALIDPHQIASNMEEHVYEGMIARYSPGWNAPAAPPSVGPVAVMAPTTMPTGRPTNAEFPTAASTPAVSIMTPEPTTTTPAAPRSATAGTNAPGASPRPPAAANALAAAKKPPAAKPQRTPAPVQIAPGTPASAPAAPATAPATSND